MKKILFLILLCSSFLGIAHDPTDHDCDCEHISCDDE